MLVIETKEQFTEVIKGHPGQMIIIDFFATWCPPCVEIGPFFKSLEEKYPKFFFCKVDVDDNPETTAACGIEAMPTFKIFKNGKELDEMVGADENELVAMMDKHQ